MERGTTGEGSVADLAESVSTPAVQIVICDQKNKIKKE